MSGKNTSLKGRTMDNIEFVINIGEHKLIISVPKQTTVAGLLSIVKGYQAIHEEYGPINSHFIGLASFSGHAIIDYWLTQPQLNFLKFKKKLELKAIYNSERKIQKLTASQFQFLKCLGKGASGQVYLVRSRITGHLFAMKRMRKQNIDGYRSFQSLIRQKNILSSLGCNNHTVSFHASFQSSAHINFVMDYYPGGELFLHLSSSKKQKLNQDQVKIYFCQILAAMEYLHRHKILYRDLKPQNILVDINGHLRIADFGLSKYNFAEEDQAFSICGSPEYMAPQIIQNKNYNFSADFYSIGALLYELLAGLPPYYKQGDDDQQQKLELMRNMVLDLDKVSENPHVKQLLKNLLNADPDLRICNFQQIKNSPWLANVDWKMIQNKTTVLPFAPEIYSSYIGSQFLDLQNEVDEMNYVDDENYDHQLDQLVYFIKPESRKLFGMSNHFQSKELFLDKNSNQNAVNMKRKTTGVTRDVKKTPKCKPNISIALFQREEGHSNIAEPKTSKHLNEHSKHENKHINENRHDNKENIFLKRDPSRKLLSKQPSNGNLLKNQQAISSQINLLKSQLSILTTNQSQTSSECSSKKMSKAKDVRVRVSDLSDGRAQNSRDNRGVENSRDNRSKCKSRDKCLKEKSLPKGGMKKKQEKKTLLPTCSYKIKLN